MATAASTATRRVALPRWPTVALAVLAALAAVSLAQGILDILVPALSGEPPFGFMLGITERLGLPFLGVYVFVHNLGLACLVAGFGFVAAKFERKPSNRRIIALLLAGSVVVSLLVGLEYLVQASDRFDLRLALPLFALEAAGVLALAIPSARHLARFVPTRALEWSLVTPLRALRVPFLVSASLLALASAIETFAMLA